MLFGGAYHQLLDLVARQAQRYRGQAAQLDLGVFINHLLQRQHEQARGVDAGQAIPARQLQVADEGTVGQHQVVVEIQAAVRATRPARCADHQAQHAVAPAAHPGIVGFSEQVVDFIHALRIKPPQWLQGEVAPGIEVGIVVAAILARRRPVEVLTEIARQRRAAAGIAGVEQKVFEVDRDELQRVGQLVAVRAACDLAVVQIARASLADPLLPASQIEQARVVAEGEAALGLATTILWQPNRAHGADALSALADVAALGRRPEAGAVVKVGQFMQQGCQQFLALGAVRSPGAIFCRRAIDQLRQ